jgi:hypothetical protein
LHSAWADHAPEQNACSIHSPDARVSRPMTSRAGRPNFAAILVARERPTICMVLASSGNSPATPRIPSVPKSLSILCLGVGTKFLLYITAARAATDAVINHFCRYYKNFQKLLTTRFNVSESKTSRLSRACEVVPQRQPS